MSTFLAAYDLLASDRNDGVDPRLALPPSRTVSRDECLRLNPLIDPAGVTGGAIWHDYQLHSPERLAIGLLDAAVREGAAAANYTEARQFVQHRGAIHAARLHDVAGGTDFELRCRTVVNAAGPWAWPLLQHAGLAAPAAAPPAMSLAMNLVVDRLPSSHAVGGLVDGRFLFLVPWRDRSIIGTSHDEFRAHPDDLTVRDAQIEGFLRETAIAFPRADIRKPNVRLVHRGLLPAARGTELLKHSIIRDHASDGIDGLITIVGVRYTTARATAASAAEHVAAKLGRASGTSSPTLTPIRDSVPESVARIRTANPTLSATLSPTCEVTRADVVHAVRHEMAMHLADVLLRRTSAGTGGHPGDEAVQAAAAVMARELGWPPSRIAEEIAAIAQVYPLS